MRIELTLMILTVVKVSRMMQDRDPMDEIRRAFKLFDEDNTGKISLRNLRKISKELGENLSEEELHAMIDEFDLDEDGESTYTEECGSSGNKKY